MKAACGIELFGIAMRSVIGKPTFDNNNLYYFVEANLKDDDKVERANLSRQLFATAELKQYKAVALINRVNLFFGTNWKAVTARYDKARLKEQPELAHAGLTISCVDTVQARMEIADILKNLSKHSGYSRNKALCHMDFGNSRFTGQVILSTVGKIAQPEMKKYDTVDTLPMVTDEFRKLLLASEGSDKTPSCSLAEALTRIYSSIRHWPMPGHPCFGNCSGRGSLTVAFLST
jgi:PRTRC genetic system ThiF family protein